MAYTKEQLDTLESAIAKGITSVQMNGRQVQYRSLTEMQRLRDVMRSELGIKPPVKSRSRMINIVGGKGL